MPQSNEKQREQAGVRKQRQRDKERVALAKKVGEREGARLRQIRHRENNKIPDICEVCGHQGVTDIHHEGEAKVIHYLCPNCHAILTRGKITLGALLERDIGERDADSVTGQGVTWETMPLEDIKELLPDDIVTYIEHVAGKYGREEQRLRMAYKYQVWHNENFIGGVHKDLAEATR